MHLSPEHPSWTPSTPGEPAVVDGGPPYPPAPGWTPGAAPSTAGVEAVPPRTDGMAIASLCCSIGGLVIGLGAVVGIVLGFVARGRIRRSGSTLTGSGLAMAGIVVGVAGLVVSTTLAAVLVTDHHGTNPAAAPIPVTAPSDVTLARQQVLPASAYPTGWQEQGPSSDFTGASFYSGLTVAQVEAMGKCLGLGTSGVVTDPAEYAAPSFDDPTGLLGASDTVDVFPDTAAARTDALAASSPRAPSCVVEQQGSSIAQGMGQGVTVTTRDITAVAVSLPTVGEQRAGMQIAVPFTTDGTSATSYSTVAEVRKGRSVSVIDVESTQAAPSAQLVDQLVSSAADHLTGS